MAGHEPALTRGYAVASTDTGHQSTSNRDTSWANGHPEKVNDFAYRSVHEMAAASKRVIEAYYGKGPKRSYWIGTSGGGQQGLNSAQKYPEDFDGIVVGAPSIYAVRWGISAVFRVKLAVAAGAAPIPPGKLKLLNAAAIKTCDSFDGLEDGVIGNPESCKIDLTSVPLASAEREMARALYEPFRNPKTGVELDPGYAPGSELGWTFDASRPDNLFRALSTVNTPHWDKPFDFATDVDLIEKRDVRSVHSTDLRAFFDRGGKLLHVHGWADPTISPFQSIRYYRSVLNVFGQTALQKSYRLYLIPGMGHNRGGVGVTQFDSTSVIEKWVEQGETPDTIAGRRVVDGKTVFSRPICPWPQIAVYRGAGDTSDAASFRCQPPPNSTPTAKPGHNPSK